MTHRLNLSPLSKHEEETVLSHDAITPLGHFPSASSSYSPVSVENGNSLNRKKLVHSDNMSSPASRGFMRTLSPPPHSQGHTTENHAYRVVVNTQHPSTPPNEQEQRQNRIMQHRLDLQDALIKKQEQIISSFQEKLAAYEERGESRSPSRNRRSLLIRSHSTDFIPQSSPRMHRPERGASVPSLLPSSSPTKHYLRSSDSSNNSLQTSHAVTYQPTSNRPQYQVHYQSGANAVQLTSPPVTFANPSPPSQQQLKKLVATSAQMARPVVHTTSTMKRHEENGAAFERSSTLSALSHNEDSNEAPKQQQQSGAVPTINLIRSPSMMNGSKDQSQLVFNQPLFDKGEAVSPRFAVTSSRVQAGLDLISCNVNVAGELYPVVEIVAVKPDSAAEIAGLARGDILLSCLGYRITSRSDFADVMAVCTPGQRCDIVYMRPPSIRQHHATMHLGICLEPLEDILHKQHRTISTARESRSRERELVPRSYSKNSHRYYYHDLLSVSPSRRRISHTKELEEF